MRNYPEPFEGKPNAAPTVDPQKIPNKGEVSFSERMPADPLKDELTMTFTHKGGLASARTEHY